MVVVVIDNGKLQVAHLVADIWKATGGGAIVTGMVTVLVAVDAPSMEVARMVSSTALLPWATGTRSAVALRTIG